MFQGDKQNDSCKTHVGHGLFPSVRLLRTGTQMLSDLRTEECVLLPSDETALAGSLLWQSPRK